eukprot:753224-Hanusia_phi.AAC.1
MVTNLRPPPSSSLVFAPSCRLSLPSPCRSVTRALSLSLYFFAPHSSYSLSVLASTLAESLLGTFPVASRRAAPGEQREAESDGRSSGPPGCPHAEALELFGVACGHLVLPRGRR